MRRAYLAVLGLSILLGGPAAMAADADVLRQFGIEGRQALDCSKPRGKNNPHIVFAVSSQGQVTRALRMDSELDVTYALHNLRIVGQDSMQFEEITQQAVLTITVAKIGG